MSAGWCLAPTAPARPRCSGSPSAQLHPTSGTVHVLGERLGRVDVSELRTRIGLSTASLHDRIPADEKVANVVITASWAVVGRFRENYDSADTARAARC